MRTGKLDGIVLILSCVLASGGAAHAVQGQLQAGTAKITITPEDTQHPVHDVCCARSLVLDIQGERLAFVSVDLGIYTSDSLVQKCKEQFGLSQLLLSGPTGFKGESRWILQEVPQQQGNK